MIRYQTYGEKMNSSDLGEYFSFGIAAVCVTEDKQEELFRIPDVSVDESLVKRICDLCTAEQLEPIHIYDVIEDNI